MAVGEEIYDEIIADKIWPGTRALAQMHLDAGQQVWLVTATPYELAATIAKRLGLTGALGTVAESVDGVFTGRLVGDILHGTGKAHAVRSLAIREGLNLRRCTAYSDSFNDVPMLSLVGTRRRHQPRRRPARTGPRAGLGDPRFPHRPQGRPHRGAVGAGARRRGRGAGGDRVAAARAADRHADRVRAANPTRRERPWPSPKTSSEPTTGIPTTSR